MAPSAPASTIRKVFEERLSRLLEEMASLFEAEVASRVSSEVDAAVKAGVHSALEESLPAARREMAEELNQAVRRLRQGANFAEISAVLADVSSSFCNGAAVFRVNEGTVTGERLRGAAPDDAEFRKLAFPVSQAAAFAGAIQTQDPLVAMSTAAEVSQPLMDMLSRSGADRVAIFPLIAQRKTVGLLCAWGAVQMAPLELLTHVAASSLPSAAAALEAVPSGADLVKILPARVNHAVADWQALTPEEQELHLRAQRFARVQVAEMRLYRADAVQSGRTRGDLYAALGDAIDSGRATFRQNFLSASPTMVDYFHLELVRTLANDNARLLGDKYPGPLV